MRVSNGLRLLTKSEHVQQAIAWTNSELLSIGTFETNVRETEITIQKFALDMIHLKMPSAHTVAILLRRQCFNNFGLFWSTIVSGAVKDFHACAN